VSIHLVLNELIDKDGSYEYSLFNKTFRTADKGWSSRLEVGRDRKLLTISILLGNVTQGMEFIA
jgi:hypothetical protein